MSSLLIIAHGSRRGASNDEVRQLADQVRAQPHHAYDHIGAAFLELAEPSIQEGLAALVAQGATDIIAFPYFLAAGTHVAQDIPEAIAEFSAASNILALGGAEFDIGHRHLLILRIRPRLAAHQRRLHPRRQQGRLVEDQRIQAVMFFDRFRLLAGRGFQRHPRSIVQMRQQQHPRCLPGEIIPHQPGM
ncbi:MAG: hypothetical protein B7Y21_13875 [Hydrogenophilales bacterium 16-61-112]|nr:MAG: hypothetical protein B7Y21_13875 [Hydrogenophilales bacterium 16-61-112]